MTALLEPKQTLFVCIDIQERLLPVMSLKDSVVKNANTLLQGASALGAKVLVTEQYVKGLGKTDESIKIVSESKVLEKTTFSIFADSEIKDFVAQSGAKNLVIFGIESHVCVLQSTIHALELGYKVWIAQDALSSRSVENHKNAIELMRDFGAKITNTESILFGSLLDSKDARFKEISKLVK